jgi:PBP1b-binding outer membrane lipoprotein LpoB
MTATKPLSAAFLILALLASGCAKEEKGPIDSAVDKTKDALDLRDHEKLKDAGEDVKAAVQDAKDGVKDAVDGKK